MDTTTTDNSPVEEVDDRDDRGKEEGASGDHDEGADDGDESGKLLYNVPKKKYQKEWKHQAQQREKLISEKIMNSNTTKVTILIVKSNFFGIGLDYKDLS